MKNLKLHYPLYPRYCYQAMPVVLIKRLVLWQPLVIAIIASSLSGLLSGCSHPASAIPHDGPTMQAIYTHTAQPGIKTGKRYTPPTRQQSATQALPKMASVVIFAHTVHAGRERVLIPTYTVQYQVNKINR